MAATIGNAVADAEEVRAKEDDSAYLSNWARKARAAGSGRRKEYVVQPSPTGGYTANLLDLQTPGPDAEA